MPSTTLWRPAERPPNFPQRSQRSRLRLSARPVRDTLESEEAKAMKGRSPLRVARALLLTFGFLLWNMLLAASDATKTTGGEHWEISGDLTEACTCAVPCTCNFGRGPSPRHYCYAL